MKQTLDYNDTQYKKSYDILILKQFKTHTYRHAIKCKKISEALRCVELYMYKFCDVLFILFYTNICERNKIGTTLLQKEGFSIFYGKESEANVLFFIKFFKF